MRNFRAVTAAGSSVEARTNQIFRRLTIFVPLAVLALAGNAEAVQAQADSVRLEQLQVRVNSQDRIRAFTYSWGLVELRRPRLAGLSITYENVKMTALPPDTAQPFPRLLSLPEVSKLQVRGSAAKSGAIIGASVLGGLGLVFGLASTRECSGGFFEYCEFSAGDVVGFTLGGAAFGALVGVLIGAPLTKWKTVYRAP